MKFQSNKSMTAAELMSHLQSDPEWVRRDREREARQQAEGRRLRAEQTPLLDELAAAGYKLNSIWDFVNTKEPYPGTIPILLKHLRRPYDLRTLEGIARALIVRQARNPAVAAELLQILRETPPDAAHHELRFALTLALSNAADRSMVNELSALATDPRYADVHGLLAGTLERLSER